MRLSQFAPFALVVLVSAASATLVVSVGSQPNDGFDMELDDSAWAVDGDPSLRHLVPKCLHAREQARALGAAPAPASGAASGLASYSTLRFEVITELRPGVYEFFSFATSRTGVCAGDDVVRKALTGLHRHHRDEGLMLLSKELAARGGCGESHGRAPA